MNPARYEYPLPFYQYSQSLSTNAVDMDYGRRKTRYPLFCSSWETQSLYAPPPLTGIENLFAPVGLLCYYCPMLGP
jgi:hypothetical protein